MRLRSSAGSLAVALVAAAIGLRSAPAHGCEMADQYRLLLLGDSAGGLVALELDQFRDQKSPTGPRYWQVAPRLVRVAAGAAATPIVVYPEVEVSDQDYVTDLAPVVARALADARKRTKHFRQASIEQFIDCHYGTSCGIHRVIQDGPGARLSTRLDARDHELGLRLPERFLRHRNAFPDLEWQEPSATGAEPAPQPIDGLTSEEITARSPEIVSGWSLGSVRTYSIGKRRVVVYNLGRGDTRYYRPRQLTPRAREIGLRAGDFVYNEDLPHHGHAFDQIQVID